LTSVTTDAGGTLVMNGGSVTTTGAQSYNDAVTLGANTTLNGVAITLASTLKSNGSNYSLTVNDSGTTTFGGAIGSATLGEKLSSLTTDSAGSVAMNAGTVYTTAAQTYNDAMILGATTTLNGVTITFVSTIKSNGTARNLTVNDSGTTSFGGAIGSTVAGEKIAMLITDSGGAVAMNAGAVYTTSWQRYSGTTLTLGMDTTMVGSLIDMYSTLAGAGYSLDIQGPATFLYGVSGLSRLAVSGTTAIITSTVSTIGTQTYTGAVSLGAATLSTTNSNVIFGGTLNSFNTGASNLTLNLGTGTAVFGDGTADTVGASYALGAIAITGSLDLNAAISNAASVSVSSTSDLGANVTTTGAQTYMGAVTLSAASSLSTGSSAAAIAFASTVNGAYALSSTTTGSTSFSGAVGGSAPLNGLTITTATLSAPAIALATNGALSVTNSGAGTVSGIISGTAVTLSKAGAGNLTLSADNSYSGSTTVNAGTLTVSSTGSLGGTAGVTSTALTISSATVDLQRALTVGSLSMSGSSPAITRSLGVSSLDVAGTSTLAGSVSTSGTQTYNGAVTLGAATTLTGSTITTNGTLAGGTYALTISGDALLGNAAVDRLTGLASLSISGTTNLYADTVTSSGAQTYTGALTLSENATLSSTSSGKLWFKAAVSGAQSLSTSTAGDTVFDASVGSTPLTGLTITTATLTAGAISLANSSALSVTNSGVGTISGTISGTGVTLSKDGAGTLTLSGANTYTGAATITAGVLSVSSVADGGLASNLGQSSNADTSLVFNGGTLQFTGAGSAATDRAFTINTGKTASFDISQSTDKNRQRYFGLVW
jgi:autotransporter-associated beta strand protein